jgi:hypothetical protein
MRTLQRLAIAKGSQRACSSQGFAAWDLATGRGNEIGKFVNFKRFTPVLLLEQLTVTGHIWLTDRIGYSVIR